MRQLNNKNKVIPLSIASMIGLSLSSSAFGIDNANHLVTGDEKQITDQSSIIAAEVAQKVLPQAAKKQDTLIKTKRRTFSREYLLKRVAELRRQLVGENKVDESSTASLNLKDFNVTQDNVAVSSKLLSGEFKLPGVGKLLGEQEEARLVIDSVEFLGSTVIANSVLQSIVAPFLGHEIDPIVDVEKMRQAVTQHYVDAGYVNSGAVIDNPEILSPSINTLQDAVNVADNIAPSSRVLRIGIVEGWISEVKIEGLENLREPYIIDRLLPYKDEVLNLLVLQERFQILLQDPLFKKIQSRILPSYEKGGAILDLKVERESAWSGYFGVNNYRNPSSGENQYAAGVTFRNLTSFGDTLNLSANTPTASIGKSSGFAASFFVPLPPFQTLLGIGYSKGQTSITEPPFDRLNFTNNNTSSWVSINQPFITSVNHILSADISLNARKSQNFINGQTASLSFGEVDGFTENKVNRLGVNYTYRNPLFSWASRVAFSKGRHNYFVDPRIAAFLATPENNYQHQVLQTVANLQVTDGGQVLSIRGNTQKTTNYLIGMERFSLTGNNAVRGYIESSFVFDNVSTASLEWQVPLYRSNEGFVISATPFYDWGEGENSIKLTEEEEKLVLSSYGVSLSAQYKGFFMRVSYARALKNLDLIREGYQQSNGLTYSLRYDY